MKIWVSGQSLPEVLTSMLLLGILMMISYAAIQQGAGLSSPVQQARSAALLREVMWEDFAPGTREWEVKGRTLRRLITCLDDQEPIFEVHLQCLIHERVIFEQDRIVRKPIPYEP